MFEDSTGSPTARFEVEQFELHYGVHEVEARSEAEAVQAILNGDGEMLHGDYIQRCNLMGMVATDELVQGLRQRGVNVRHSVVPSIRSVRPVGQDVTATRSSEDQNVVVSERESVMLRRALECLLNATELSLDDLHEDIQQEVQFALKTLSECAPATD